MCRGSWVVVLRPKHSLWSLSLLPGEIPTPGEFPSPTNCLNCSCGKTSRVDWRPVSSMSPHFHRSLLHWTKRPAGRLSGPGCPRPPSGWGKLLPQNQCLSPTGQACEVPSMLLPLDSRPPGHPASQTPLPIQCRAPQFVQVSLGSWEGSRNCSALPPISQYIAHPAIWFLRFSIAQPCQGDTRETSVTAS